MKEWIRGELLTLHQTVELINFTWKHVVKNLKSFQTCCRGGRTTPIASFSSIDLCEIFKRSVSLTIMWKTFFLHILMKNLTFFYFFADICDTAPCENGGTCIERTLYYYMCICPIGYIGEFCQVGRYLGK